MPMNKSLFFPLTSQNNTFQCVLVTDGNLSFVSFLYANENITTLPESNQTDSGIKHYSVEAGFSAAIGGKGLSILTPSISSSSSSSYARNHTTLQYALGFVATGNTPGQPGVWTFGVNDVNYLSVPGKTIGVPVGIHVSFGYIL